MIEEELSASEVKSVTKLRDFSNDQKKYFGNNKTVEHDEVAKSLHLNTAQKKTINYINNKHPRTAKRNERNKN